MQRWLGAAVVVGFFSVQGFCADHVARSSTTLTADTTAVLCGGGSRGLLYSVITSSAGAGGMQLTIYNSSWTATNVAAIGPIMNTTVGEYDYFTQLPGGMMYTKTGTAAVTMLYDCF